MRDNGSAADDVRCIEFVSVVTDYLDGEVNDEDRRRIDKHLEHCRGCQAALAQFQAVMDSLVGCLRWMSPASTR